LHFDIISNLKMIDARSLEVLGLLNFKESNK
jgi:hypothetical protein